MMARQELRHGDAGWVELGARLHAAVVDTTSVTLLEPADMAVTLRGLTDAVVRLEPAEEPGLIAALQGAEQQFVEDLRRPSDADREARIVKVVTPLVAAVVA
jgi:hypothetical protein